MSSYGLAVSVQQIQNVSFVGQKRSFDISVRTPENYPVDVYMLMDMSYSMRDNLPSVETLGSDLGMFAAYDGYER